MACLCTPQKKKKENAKRSKARNDATNLSPIDDIVDLEYDPTAELGTNTSELPTTGSVPVLATKSIPVLSGGNGTELSLERLNELFAADRMLLARVAVADWHARLLAKEMAVLSAVCDEAPEHLDELGKVSESISKPADDGSMDQDDAGEVSAMCAAELSVQADETVVEQTTKAARPLLDRLKAATNAAASALSSLIDAATASVASSTNTAVAARGAPLVASCQQGQPAVVRLAQALIALTQHFDQATKQATTAFELLDEARQASAQIMGIRAASTALHGAKQESDETLDSITAMLTGLQQLLTVRAAIRSDLWTFLDKSDKALLDENALALAGDATAQPELALLACAMADAELATADRACLDTAQQLRTLLSLPSAAPDESSDGSGHPAATALTAAATLQGIIRDTHEALVSVPAPLATVDQQSRELAALIEQIHNALHRTSTLPSIPPTLADKGALADAAASVASQTDAAATALGGAQAALGSVFGDMDEEPVDFLGGCSPAHMSAGKALAGHNVTLSLLIVRLTGMLDHLRSTGRTMSSLPASLAALHDGVAEHLYTTMRSFLDAPRTPSLSRSASQHNVLAAAGVAVPPPGAIIAANGRADPEPPESEASGPYVEPARQTATNQAVSAATSGKSPTTVRRALASVPRVTSQLNSDPLDEIRRVELVRGAEGLGFSFGTSTTQPEVLVMTVKPGSVADRSLQVFPEDHILSVNGVKTLGLAHERIMELLQVPRVVLELSAPHPDCMYATLRAVLNSREFDFHRITLPKQAGRIGASLVSVDGRPGHVVASVDSDGAAAKAGVQVNDIVVALDCENALTMTHEALAPRVALGGCQLTVARHRTSGISRSSSTATRAPAVVSEANTNAPKAPEAAGSESGGDATTPARTGARLPPGSYERIEVILTRIDGKLGMTISSAKNEHITIVADVVPGGAADKAGIRCGDFIASVDGQDTSTLAHSVLTASLSKKQPMHVVLERPKATPETLSKTAAVIASATAAASVSLAKDSMARPTGDVVAETSFSSPALTHPPSGSQSGVAQQPETSQQKDATSEPTLPATTAAQSTITAAAAAAASASAPAPLPTAASKASISVLEATTGTNSEAWAGLETARSAPTTVPVGLMAAAIVATGAEEPVQPQISALSLSSQPERKPLPAGDIYKVVLMRSLTGSLGLRIRTEQCIEGSVVAAVPEDGPAYKTRLIQRGDYLLSVNNERVVYLDHSAIIRLLRVAENPVTLEFLRPSEPTNAVARTESLREKGLLPDQQRSMGYSPYDQAAATAGLKQTAPWPGAVMPPAPPTSGAHQYHSLSAVASLQQQRTALAEKPATDAPVSGTAAVASDAPVSPATLAGTVATTDAESSHPAPSSSVPTSIATATAAAATAAAASSTGPKSANSYSTIASLQVDAQTQSAPSVAAGSSASDTSNAGNAGPGIGSASSAAKRSEPQPLNPAYLEDSEEEEGPTLMAPPRLVLPKEEVTFNAKDARRVRLKRDAKLGFGMRLRTLEQRPGTRVLEVLPNSPAAKTKKINQGDVIYSINGEVVVHADHETVSQRIQAAQQLDLQLIPQPPELLLPRFVAAEDPTPAVPQRERRQPIPFPPSVRAPKPQPGPGATSAYMRVAVIGDLRNITLTPRRKARLGLGPPPAGYYFPVVRAACKGARVGDALISINGVSTLGRDLATLSAVLRELGTCGGEVGTEVGPGHYVQLCRGERAFGLKLSCGDEQGVTIGTVKADGSAAQCPVLREGSWVCLVNDTPAHKSVSDVTSAIAGQTSLVMLVVGERDAQLMRHVAARCTTLLPVPVDVATIQPSPLEATILDKQFHPADPTRTLSVVGLAGSIGGGSSSQLSLAGNAAGGSSAALNPRTALALSIPEEPPSPLPVLLSSKSSQGSAIAAATTSGPHEHTALAGPSSSTGEVPTDPAEVVAALTAVTAVARESAAREQSLRAELAARETALQAAQTRIVALESAEAALRQELARKAEADALAAAQVAAAKAELEEQRADLERQQALLKDQRQQQHALSAGAHTAQSESAAHMEAERTAVEQQVASLTAKLEESQAALVAATTRACEAEHAAAEASATAEAATEAAASEVAAARDKAAAEIAAARAQAEADVAAARAQAEADVAAARTAAEQAQAEAQAAAAAAAAKSASVAAVAASPAPATQRRSQASSPIVSEDSEDAAPSSPSGRARRVSPLRKASSVPTDAPEVFIGSGESGEYMDIDGSATLPSREQDLAFALAAAQAEIEQLRAQLEAAKTSSASGPLPEGRERRPTLSPTPQTANSSSPIGSPRPVRSQRVSRTFVEEKVEDVDKEVQSIVSRLRIPAGKVSCIAKEKYRFFDDPKVVNVRIIGKNVMVRVGGGWQRLEEFLLGHANFQTQSMD